MRMRPKSETAIAHPSPKEGRPSGVPLWVLFAMWTFIPSVRAQIPEGFETVDITWENASNRFAAINDCGQVVFSRFLPEKGTSDIFLYDNCVLTNISDNEVGDSLPDINNHGDIVWRWGNYDFGRETVVLLKQSLLSVLGDGEWPTINDQGHVVWQRELTDDCTLVTQIYYYDGISSTVLFDNGGTNRNAHITDGGHVTWNQYAFCENPWKGSIWFLDDAGPFQLPAFGRQINLPVINNLDTIAWSGPGRRSGSIQVWQNGKTEILTDWGANPAINDKGDIYFIRNRHEDEDAWQPWLYHDKTFTRLAFESVWNTDGDINNYMECAWERDDFFGTNFSGIRLMRRVRTGEFDFDGDVDRADYAELAGCLTGPDWPGKAGGIPEQSLCKCRFADIDHDNDIDLADFARFQNNYTGRDP